MAEIDDPYAGAERSEGHAMNAQWFNATPLLPNLEVQYLAVHLGWGLVLAALLLWVVRRRTGMDRKGYAVLIAFAFGSCFLPGTRSPAYWLGLAFQAPSLVIDCLCIWYLQNCWRDHSAHQNPMQGLLAISSAGALLGWLLLLDALALLPWQIYAMGLNPLTTAAVFFVGLLPWMLHGRSVLVDRRTWIVPLAICFFVALRWPSGNVWDAVFDPLLWIWLNGFVLRSIWKFKK